MIRPALLDVVELLVAIPGENLPLGAQGTLVHQHNHDEFEVEFVDERGETIALCPLNRQQFVVVWQASTETAVSIPDQIAQVVDLLPSTARNDVLDFARFLSTRQTSYPLAA